MNKEKRTFTFDELKHAYELDGKRLISVSQLIALYKNKFDKEYWSLYTAIRLHLNMEKKDFSRFLIVRYKFNFGAPIDENLLKLKDIAFSLGVPISSPTDVQKEWKKINKESTDRGTKYHNEVETGIISDKGTVFNGEYAEYKSYPDLHNLAGDKLYVYPELRMYNEEYGLAGTSDEVYIYPNKTFYVDDSKTNKKIDMENKYQKMLFPLDHLDDTNYNHYRLQISIYAWMLEGFGYDNIGTKFTWKRLDENGNLIEAIPFIFPMMRSEVKLMLEHYKENYLK